MELTVAKMAGFCFGVERAVKMIESELEKGQKIYCLGELIHNPWFVSQLEKKGMVTCGCTAEDIDRIPADGRIFIRTHGIDKAICKKLEAEGRSFVDATCPYVKKIHSIVEQETADGTPVIIIGAAEHPEVIGIKSHVLSQNFTFSSHIDLEKFLNSPENREICERFDEKGVVLVAQTTQNVNEWKKCIKLIEKLYTKAKIFDTICKVTGDRQREAAELAEQNDAVIVIGGKTSSNTAKLYETAKAVLAGRGLGGNAVFVEGAEDIKRLPEGFFRPHMKLAITAGASTPRSIIQEVITEMTENNNGEMSFAEMLDQSFKTLKTGERVEGTVSAVNAAEIHVDLGIKHTGILPYDEITDESGVDLESKFHVGDKINVIVSKFNETEGTVLLSKKRLDAEANWEDIKKAYEEKTILEGTVKDVVKGGVRVIYKGVRVFIPASLCGLGKDADVETLKGAQVKFEIIEVNDQRKDAVGSMRAVAKAERKKEIEEFYASLEVGQKFIGTVSSMTDYGLFVKIGPVDGMVHITELFWGHKKKLSDVYKPGDKIEVFVKSVNPEKRRISLGYKTEENDPWKLFREQYNAGDIAEAKIVSSVMPHGAFAEIIPGIEGLIHVSQISVDPVQDPSTVLTVGETVGVKITAINDEKRRVSLSIKALLPQEKAEEEAPAEAAPAEEAPVAPAAEEAPAEAAPVEEAPAAPAADEAPAEDKPEE